MARPRIETDLVTVFRSARVLTLDELVHRLSVSRRTVFRRLSAHGYFGSYNASGRFLTIREVANFDTRGLWSFKGARFSRYGNLRETVVHFVGSSASGMTHEEISDLLGVRVHNTLRALAHEGAISRDQLGGVFVYLNASTRVRQAQVKGRCSILGDRAIRPTSGQVIAVLLELIQDPKASREGIVARCQGAGVRITRVVVDEIFSRYDLDKKRAL